MLPASETIVAAAIFAAIGSGAMGGLLFAFSSFVMRALAQQAPECGVRTMQTINILIINPLFMILFMGTALVSGALAIIAVLEFSRPGMGPLLVGCVLYVAGVFGITMVRNVPLNNVLAVQRPESLDAAQYWPMYVARWQRWNHIRTVASLVASGFFITAIHVL